MSAETSGPSITKLHEPWQSRVFGYYDLLGECWNPAQFYARGLAKIRYFPAKKLPDGTLEEIEDGPAADALSMISHIAPDYGRLLFLIGEGRLCQSLPPDADPSDPVVWEFLSPTEVSLTNEGRTIQRDIGGSEKVEYVNISDDPEGAEPQPGEMRMWRFWRKHPRNSTRADSPVRPVIDLYEQLWWLTMRERAELQSRIADVGLMLIPEEIDFSPEGDAEEEAKDGDDPEVEPFQAYVGEMFMAAIRDPGTAPAAIPGVIRGPAEYLHPDFFRMLHIREGGESLQTSEREQAILQRLAVALDMPPAALTGIGTLNHWNAWKNEDEKWQHIEPVAELFATDIAAAYLRPLLIASGDSPAEAEATYVGYDNSEFLRDPDRGATAVTLNKQGLLSAEKTLEANGWSDDQDRMPDDEHLEWLAIQLKDKTIAGFEPDPAPVVAAPAGQDQPTDQQEQPPPGAQDGPDAAAQVVRARAVEYAVRRARAAAGSVARSARRSCPECFEGTNAVPSEDLIAALGPEKTGRVVNERRLVDAMAVAFVATLHDLGWNADPDQAVAYFEETIFSAAPWPVDWLVEVTANGDTG
jgi:hypothetical protein